MKIREIELIGFKSFADRTLIALHSGITCIVGPNGCGKSNVVDAFRWVLGEQSAKSLRGEKMEEVIFQGSSTKKQKGMAEVVLVFSQSDTGKPENGNGDSDSAGDKIVVSRRLYRSGESEYLLNKRQCRLRDIKDIFLDTGLDVKSYSILDQGRISDIINSKPLDRRFLIEEVAGVMKYKVRKAEALSKLESSKQNLQRISDIVYEVKRQINSLDRQVKKAERYKRLSGELKDLELRVFRREFLKLSAVLTSLISDLEKLRALDSAKRGELSDLENQLETKRLGLTDREKALSEIEKLLHEKERTISETEKRIAVLKTSMEGCRADIARFLAQQEDAGTRKEELLRKRSELDDTESSLASDIEGITASLEEKKVWVSNIEMTISDNELTIEGKRKDLFRLSGALSDKKNELHKFQSSRENLIYREGVALKDMETIKGELASLREAIAESDAFIQGRTAEQQKLQAERDALKTDIDSIINVIENKKILLSQKREELASNTSRLNSLKELIVDRTLTEFLSESENTEGHGYAVLSDVLSANKDYEKAIEAALSERVNSLIVDNIEEVMAAVRIIKEKNLGKTAILYTGYGTHDTSVIDHEAIIGRAADFITFENIESQNKARNILADTYIVKDLRSAIEFRKSTQTKGIILVTLDGEVIDSDGIIFAGQGREILKKKREIKELQHSIIGQQAFIANTDNELSGLANELAEKKTSLENIGNRLIELEKDLSLAAHSLSAKHEELERKERKLSFLEAEISDISGEKESLAVLMSSKISEIAGLDAEIAVINENTASVQQALADSRREYDEAQSQLHDMKVVLATTREKINALKNEVSGINRTITELEERKDQAIKEVHITEEKIQSSVSELQALEEAIKTMVSEADIMTKERSAQKESIEAENEALAAEGSALKTLRSEIDILSQQLGEANTKAVENRLKIENIENGVMQKYGLSIAAEEIVTEGFEQEEDESSINQLNEKMRDLGPVNLGTIEEYEELKTRYDFLTKQQQDLTMSIAELEEAISRINATTRKKLREAYDALRTKFVEVFTHLFGGGRADIILTDEESILESGLDIIAQPPGKKLQNLNLLSGGEKALTSLALLFAGFLIKPSPLCILDEADAPLDESNTVRFAQMIKDLSGETQFIVITHNRTTMEVADYLYGVTMEDPGSSKTISIQFSDVENIAAA